MVSKIEDTAGNRLEVLPGRGKVALQVTSAETSQILIIEFLPAGAEALALALMFGAGESK